MNPCKVSKVIYVIRKCIEIVLGIGFFVLSILALKDLLSKETTLLISRKFRNASLPSFTACPYATNAKFLNSTLLRNGAMMKNFPISVSAHMQSKTTGKYTVVDLLNSTDLLDYYNISYENTWTNHCKIYPTMTDLNSCVPCITFRNPVIMEKVELVLV